MEYRYYADRTRVPSENLLCTFPSAPNRCEYRKCPALKSTEHETAQKDCLKCHRQILNTTNLLTHPNDRYWSAVSTFTDAECSIYILFTVLKILIATTALFVVIFAKKNMEFMYFSVVT